MTVYICGDSTASSYPETHAPQTGWGQVIGDFLPGIPVENRAMAGRSTKSFLAEGRLQRIETEIQQGDLLLIQFTHNDASELVWRHTDPWTSFRANLEIFVDTALQNLATPVLMTPICIRNWQDGVLHDSHGDYPAVIRLLALQRKVPLIDLYAESFRLVSGMGEEESRKLYMHVQPDIYPDFMEGLEDNAHTQRAGAEAYARIAAETMKKLGLV